MRLPIILTLCLAGIAPKQPWKKLVVDPKRTFTIYREGERESTVSGDEIISADLSMPTTEDASKAYGIRFAKALLTGDTLTITISEWNEAYSHTYTIQVTKGKYRVGYDFDNSGEEVERVIVTDDFSLVLNRSDFKKGSEIRGYTDYRGHCEKGCWPSHSKFDIKGCFLAVIR